MKTALKTFARRGLKRKGKKIAEVLVSNSQTNSLPKRGFIMKC